MVITENDALFSDPTYGTDNIVDRGVFVSAWEYSQKFCLVSEQLEIRIAHLGSIERLWLG